MAERHAAIAAQDVTQQRHAYAATVVSSYEMGPSLSPLSAVTSSDGLPGVISKMATLQNAQDAMDHTYDSFRASSTLAGVASTQAEAARTHAETLRHPGACRSRPRGGRGGRGGQRLPGDRGPEDG